MWSPISRALQKTGFIGRIGPVSTRSPQPPTYGLLVDAASAHEELAYQFNRRGWGNVSREEFNAALKSDGIAGFTARSPEAAEHKRWKDRKRQRMAKAA